MAERKKLEVTILPQNFTETQQEQARKNISAAPMSDVSSLSAKTVTKINGDECLKVTSARNPDGTIEYSLAVTAEPTDTRIQGKDGVYASRVQGDEGLWTVGLSGKYLSANALNNLSGNWENAYKAVSAYSGDFASWKREYELVSTNSAKWDKVTSKLDASAFSSISGNFALSADVARQFDLTSSWATRTFQPVGDYLSASEKYLSANALDSISAEWNKVSAKLDKTAFETWSAQTENWDISAYSGKDGIQIKDHWIFVSADYALSADVDNRLHETSSWANDTFQVKGNYLSANALDNYSGKWNSVFNSVSSTSAEWNSVYETVDSYSGDWEEAYITLTSTSAEWNKVSAKLDKADFDTWSAKTKDWDISAYSGDNNIISVNNHIISANLSAYYKKFETSASNELDDRFEPIEEDIEYLYEDVEVLKENSAHNTVTSLNEYITVHSGTNEFELEFLSGDLATEKWVNEQLGKFGGYVPCEGIGADNHPNVNDPDPKKMYLVPKDDTTEPDRYYNWIVTGDETTGWLCIGDTSIDLTPYVKISDISAASATWDSAYDWTRANSAKTMEVNSVVDTYSADWNNHSALSAVVDTKLDAAESAKFMLLSDIQGNADGKIIGYGNSAIYHPTYYGKDGITVEDYIISISADYLSANALDQLSGNWNSVYDTVETNSGNWNSVYDTVETNSGNWNSVYDTVETNSANWNEASAFSANSGKFVTSGDEIEDTDLAYVLKKTGDNVAWSGIDLSDLGKIYPITSITPDLVSATISAVNDIPTYVLSAKETDPVVYYDVSANRMSAWSGIDNDINYYFLQGANISGNNGISAEYDPENNQWDIGLRTPSYNYAAARTNVTTMTATSETLSGFVDISTAGITFEDDIVTLDKGLYHVDIQVNIPIDEVDESYYDVTLTPSLSNAILCQTIDSTYIHNTTLDLSFDINLLTDNNALTFTLDGLPVGGKYRVANFQIHEVTTIDSLIDVIGGDYAGGDGINVDNENKINVNVDTASGIGINANNQLYVKLGKGLKFDTEGAAEGTLTLDNVTEEVVETVQSLQVELEGKLTTNMNISDAKNVGCPFYNAPSTPTLGAALFTVPLNHKINNDTEISFFTSQVMNQSFPIMIGLLEYNFKYYDIEDNTLITRSQTKWIADTGLIWSDTRAVDGNWIGQRDDQAPNNKANRKYTFKFKNVTDVISGTVTDPTDGTVYTNIVSPEMRSDRAYYLAFFGRAGQGMSYFLGDDGYSITTNSDPYLSFYVNNMQYYETEESTGIAMSNWNDAAWEAHSGMSMSSINYWSREGEANTIARPLVLIRNNVQ